MFCFEIQIRVWHQASFALLIVFYSVHAHTRLFTNLLTLLQTRTYFYKQQSKLWNVRLDIPKSYKLIFLFYVFIGNFNFQRPKKVIFPLTLFRGLQKDKALGVTEVSGHILQTETTERTKWPFFLISFFHGFYVKISKSVWNKKF